jgi:hypothetical protein
MTPSNWPRGIDVIAIMWREALAHYTASRGLTGSAAIDDRATAMAAYVTSRAYPDGAPRQGRLQLARLLIRHFRRELINRQRYLEATAGRALMGAVSTKSAQ